MFAATITKATPGENYTPGDALERTIIDVVLTDSEQFARECGLKWIEYVVSEGGVPIAPNLAILDADIYQSLVEVM